MTGPLRVGSRWSRSIEAEEVLEMQRPTDVEEVNGLLQDASEGNEWGYANRLVDLAALVGRGLDRVAVGAAAAE